MGVGRVFPFSFVGLLSLVVCSFVLLGQKMECQREQQYDDWLLNLPMLSHSAFDSISPRRSELSDSISIGRRIVEWSYNETYADLVQFCKGKLSNRDPLDTFQQCLTKLYQEQKKANSTYAAKWPWWFQTLIRDMQNGMNGLFGRWHFLEFQNQTTLCVYEKGGTKQWRYLQCEDLKARANFTFETAQLCFTEKTPKKMSLPKSVFLRDPLERFLSAFLDKCIHPDHRKRETHCQPTSIFLKDTDDYVLHFLNNTKKLFEMHVDSSPLKWDLHFFPLATHCGGLYGHIGSYDFVGSMDENFYDDIARFADEYPEVNATVRRVFKLQSKEGAKNEGTENKAALKTEQYYSPRTLRKVLEYTSIDYMLLNLSIPQWAEDMLREDTEIASFQQDSTRTLPNPSTV